MILVYPIQDLNNQLLRINKNQ